MGIGSTTYPTLMDEGKGSTAIFAALCKGRSAVQLISSSATGFLHSFDPQVPSMFDFCGWKPTKGEENTKKTPIHGWHPERVQVVKYNDKAL